MAPKEIEEFNEMADSLRSDVDACYSALKADYSSQFARRQLCRAFFAQVEGIVYGYKQIALLANTSDLVDFSVAEQAMLREETYELDNAGEVNVRSARLPFASNFLFSMKALSRTFNTQRTPPTDRTGWEKFRASARVRDRLMHPKNVGSLNVSDSELRDLFTAHQWFLDCRAIAITRHEKVHTLEP